MSEKDKPLTQQEHNLITFEATGNKHIEAIMKDCKHRSFPDIINLLEYIVGELEIISEDFKR